MKTRMRSLMAHTYAGRRLAVGAPFDARGQSDVRLLVALGRAEIAAEEAPAPTAPPVEPRRYGFAGALMSRATEAKVEAKVEAELEPMPAKRRYRRRDVVAEE